MLKFRFLLGRGRGWWWQVAIYIAGIKHYY